jgi:hypothetical protein
MVVGDDSIVLRKINGVTVVIEGDYSMYDQSQRKYLQKMMYTVLSYIGSADLVEIWRYVMNSRKLKVQFKNIDRFQIKIPVMQLTGIATTSVLNSLANILVSVQVHLNFNDDEDLEDLNMSYSLFGLEIKSRSVLPEDGPTFLKGWFLMTGSEFIWHPLPSQIVKMGKILTNPSEIAKHIPKDRRKRTGYKLAAYALSRSYGNIHPSYPILGPLLAKLEEYGKKSSTHTEKRFDYKMKVTMQNAGLRTACLKAIETRWGITESEVCSFEAHISNLILPCVYYHPLLLRIMTEFYGDDFV